MNAQTIQDRMLSAMLPAGGAVEPANWQQRKSAQMRARLVGAALECLVEGGYPGLTTAAVAQRSGVSRGAMHHHFATRIDLVSALIEHVVYERMRGFLADYFAAIEGRAGAAMMEIACEAHWRSVQTREYGAFLELAAAARTDAELAALFEPASRRYDAVWIGEMIEAFPQWRESWEAFKLVNDFVDCAHMGMLLHRPIYEGSDRTDRMRAFVARVAQSLFDSRDLFAEGSAYGSNND